MRSKRQNSNSKTRERKLEAMRMLKAAFNKATESGSIKSYTVSQ